MVRQFAEFVRISARLVSRGNRLYFAWCSFLLVLIAVGAVAYARQLEQGLIVTALRDPVSWGFYIGNFTFLVGVAAAAVVLVIPAYLYHWGPIKEIVVIGELLAISAIVMCMLFVTVDIGRPERFWHLFPVIGRANFPSSMLSWDVLVLNIYLLLNLAIATHVLYRAYFGRPFSKRFAWPLILLSIPAAVSIHTVTAFLFSGLASRPYWNSAILAPRFLASAFCSGPAIILVLLQLLRRFTDLKIKDEALWKIAELMAYAIAINLFLLGAEVFREFYSGTHHIIHIQYLFLGLHGHDALLPYAWTSLIFALIAFVLFLLPRTRKNPITLNLGAVLIYVSVYIEKGVAHVIPGFTPSTLNDMYEYSPSWTEIAVSAGIFGIGFLLFTLMVKVAVPVLTGVVGIPGGGGPPPRPAVATP